MKLSLFPFPTSVLPLLRAPALKKLSLEWADRETVNPQSEIDNLLAIQTFVLASGIGNSLRELKLNAVFPASSDALVSLLSDLSAMSRLSLAVNRHTSFSPSKLLLALRWPDDVPTHASESPGQIASEDGNLLNMKICPSLAYLKIPGAEKYPDLLVSMMRSRARGTRGVAEKEGPSVLKCLGLGCSRESLLENLKKPDHELRWLAEAVQDGIINFN